MHGVYMHGVYMPRRDKMVLMMCLNCIVAGSSRRTYICALRNCNFNYPITPSTCIPFYVHGPGYYTSYTYFSPLPFWSVHKGMQWIWGMQELSLALPQSHVAGLPGHNDIQTGPFTSSSFADLLRDPQGDTHFSDTGANGFHSGVTPQSTPVSDFYLNGRIQPHSDPPSRNPPFWSPFDRQGASYTDPLTHSGNGPVMRQPVSGN